MSDYDPLNYGITKAVERGAYGIEAVAPNTPGALVCGECGRAWTEDITPAGRCPWEWDHNSDEDEEV